MRTVEELDREVMLLTQLNTAACNQRDAALVRIQQLKADNELLKELVRTVAVWQKACRPFHLKSDVACALQAVELERKEDKDD